MARTFAVFTAIQLTVDYFTVHIIAVKAAIIDISLYISRDKLSLSVTRRDLQDSFYHQNGYR